MDDFCHLAGFFDVKRYRALHAIEIVIESGFGTDKQRSGDAAQVEPLCQKILEEVLYGLDGYLGLVKIQR
jgi:hypothetical protein